MAHFTVLKILSSQSIESVLNYESSPLIDKSYSLKDERFKKLCCNLNIKLAFESIQIFYFK